MQLIDEYLIKTLIVTVMLEEFGLALIGEKKIKTYVICLVLNMVTNPLMNIVLGSIYFDNYYLKLFFLESVVYLFEFFIYYLFNKDFKKALLISIVCNSLSLFLGVLF